MNEEHKKTAYVSIRVLELIFAAVMVLGAMWEGAEILTLSVPQFMILYGIIGTIACEASARLLNPHAKFRGDEQVPAKKK